MPIIAARRYIDGKPCEEHLTVDGAERVPLAKHSFDWVGLCEPSRDEMELVRRQFGLHPLAVEDAMTPTQLPKVEIYGKQLFVVVRTAEMEVGEKIEYGQTAMFLGPDFIVSVRYGSARAHSDLRTKLEMDSLRLVEGPDFVLHAILDFIVDGYQPLLDRLDEAVLAMEEQAINVFPKQSTIRRIFRLRRQLVRFERIIGPTEEVCGRLVAVDLPAIDHSATVWFRDVLDHVRRTLARIRGLRETLASIVDTASLMEAHRQGEMTRQLAAWAAILAVPTAIAGIYGMNFDNLPELHWRYGYFIVLGVIAAICGGLFWRFKRIGWL